MNDIEETLQKILKMYRQWQSEQTREIAEEIEIKLDLLKAAIGDRFYELNFFVRIGSEVTRFLNDLQRKESIQNEDIWGEPVESVDTVLNFTNRREA